MFGQIFLIRVDSLVYLLETVLVESIEVEQLAFVLLSLHSYRTTLTLLGYLPHELHFLFHSSHYLLLGVGMRRL